MNVFTNSSRDFDPQLLLCAHIYLSWSLICLLSLPLFLFVIGLAIQNCRNPKPASHSDVFTFNMSALEVIGVTGACIPSLSYFDYNPALGIAGENLIYLATLGQTLFHLLVCAERYFAVVHPVAYLRRKNNAALVRDRCIGAVWLYSFVMACLYNFKNTVFLAVSIMFIWLSSLVLIVFFCARVLRVLMRPGPGKRRHQDQSKRRALCMMTVITAALLFKFVVLFFSFILYTNQEQSVAQMCLLAVSAQWFNIPSSLVLPFLLFYRHVIQRKTTPKNPK